MEIIKYSTFEEVKTAAQYSGLHLTLTVSPGGFWDAYASYGPLNEDKSNVSVYGSGDDFYNTHNIPNHENN